MRSRFSDVKPAARAFREEWGIDANYYERGGLAAQRQDNSPRRVWLLQRKEAKVGAGLNPQRLHSACRHRPHAMDAPHRHIRHEARPLAWSYDANAVRLVLI